MIPQDIRDIRHAQKLPLKGLSLLRWKLSISLHRLACAIGGFEQHVVGLEFDDHYNEYYCSRCGWTPTYE